MKAQITKERFGIWCRDAVGIGRSFLRDNTGATAVEYALLLLISIAVVGAVYQVGSGINAVFEKVIEGFASLGF